MATGGLGPGELRQRSVRGGSGEPVEGGSMRLSKKTYNQCEGTEFRCEDKQIVQETVIVVALYDFISQDKDKLSFKKGDEITVNERNESGWWMGTLKQKTGYIPSNYVELKDKTANTLSKTMKIENKDATTSRKYKTGEILDRVFEKGCRTSMTVKLPHKGYGIWLGKDEKTVYIGGERCNTLMIIHDQGDNIDRIELPVGEHVLAITSGMCLDHNTLLIIVLYKHEREYTKLFRVTLSLNQQIENISEIDLNKPILLFDFSDSQLGISCRSTESLNRRVEMLDRISLDIKKVIHFEQPPIQKHQTITSVCRTPTGEFIMSDHKNHTIYKHAQDGTYLDSFGNGSNEPHKMQLGILCYPQKVYSLSDGFIVVCADSLLHRFEGGSWAKFTQLGNDMLLRGLVATQNHLYTMYDFELTIYSLNK